jgi:hypothetical protein
MIYNLRRIRDGIKWGSKGDENIFRSGVWSGLECNLNLLLKFMEG